MTARGGWWRRLVVCATSVAMVGVGLPSARAAQAGTTKTVPVQELSSVVLKLIKTVEGSTLACETRNSVVRRLRELDDALLSGRRSAALALALAWRQDAWSMEATRLIGPELGSSIQNRLARMQGKIGSGYAVKPGSTRHWKPLPSCETSGTSAASSTGFASGSRVLGSTSAAAGTYHPASDPMADLKIFIKAAIGVIGAVLNITAPGAGTVMSSVLSGVVDLVWPTGVGTDTPNTFQDLAAAVDAALYNQVKWQVDSIGGKLGGVPGGWNDQVSTWQTYCKNNGGFESYLCVNKARSLWSSWDDIYKDFLGYRAAFQASGDEVNLLPLFAAYENLFLSFLRDGVQLHTYWRERTDLNPDWLALDDSGLGPTPLAAMDVELNPNYVDPMSKKPDRGIGYVDSIYQMGLDQQPSAATKADWSTRNAYIRDKTINVLDFRDMWKYFDPRTYPDGVPGGVKLTRMIYSDLIYDEWEADQTIDMGDLPGNVAGPLSELTLWTKTTSSLYGWKAIGSAQATGPPLLGPAQSGAITGDTAQAVNHAHYYDLGARGPISQVTAQLCESGCKNRAISSIDLVWARDGSEAWQGTFDSDQTLDYPKYTKTFAYDGEVLATVQAIGLNNDNVNKDAGYTADTLVFGFRYADSFNPAGEVIGVGSGLCMRLPDFTNGTQAVLSTCSRPAAPDQIWGYDQGLQQISVTNPADGSKHCLGSAGAWRGPVVIGACDDGALTYDANGNPVVSGQRWSIEAVGSGIGKFTNVKSGLVLSGNYTTPSNGAKLVLYDYSGTASQQWKVSDPLTGEIHGVGSGRCVDVPNYSTTPGTQVQISDCHGNWAQQWTYNPTNKELIYAHAPSMCLEARGGGSTSGTAVQINTCTGAAEQQWTLHGDGGYISNDKSGLELSVPGGATGNGALLQLITANGTQAQQWSRTSVRGGAVYAVGAGKCLTAPAWASGTIVVIQNCTSPLSAAQTWTYHPIAQTFTVTGPSGAMCLDLEGGFTDAGTEAAIYSCIGRTSQRWVRNFGNQTLTNVTAGRVLTVYGGGTADGTPVVILSLHAPLSSIQQWVWSLS